jgi:crotonobetainyl-CoA:carnitine CoA-transferase CaiB-like acyl-CoA transferase
MIAPLRRRRVFADERVATATAVPPRAAVDRTINVPGPLHSVRIVDMTSVLMGPYATQILGDLSAGVIKVEPPAGDMVRGIGPCRHVGMGAIFLNTNRSKCSIVIDLKPDEGRAVLLDPCREADVLIYSFRSKAMARLGLSYEDVAAVSQRIVYPGLAGFCQNGPYAARPAYDDLIQGAVGFTALFALSGDEPRYVPNAVADRVVGMRASTAICAALFEREREGQGQSIEIPMFETMTEFLLGDHMQGKTFEPPLGPPGYHRQLARERRPYRTRDGYVCALIYNDKQWRAFLRLIGREDLMRDDPCFRSVTTRRQHRPRLRLRRGGARDAHQRRMDGALRGGRYPVCASQRPRDDLRGSASPGHRLL